MSRQRNADLDRLFETGIVGILRGVPAEKTIDVAAALADGGVDVIEVTADTDGALNTIDRLSSAFDRSEVLVGAGTVLDGETAGAALRAGAEFVVTPSFDAEVVRTCNRYGAVVAPGVMTPTEAVDAYEAGADLLKVFPASTLGPGHVGSLKGPLEHLPLLPTGGVSLDNVEAFVEAGADGVGVGSSLVDSEAVAAGDYGVLTERAEAFRESVENARK
ncbi:bifunctional 4-hydroxy-2-oxoglutarate aldolase/2-dehydro-3-deoxy-phosphogluconate aldolase [Halobellus limi]|uniref:2-dehydro-3-deoxyphosphogluconate aldolase / (4S)-4-hydroxy-2-oxoglutarate aldolase n=1 Tax=Halobellus limi TaxID=699433 RepID=A0A1H6BHM6_9EURY|nr:bifunctional 4-hydroxy-2-oxoglutarate aldolase/2-dehydro-3-deoxy-phosphogluconate aldolase [Halobellus limi]QCC49046.1 bifunctional 4-hydroxy-2-oxoglutarate aldolase/2-dehydro-3-deoxy-phosphogluconate aldolase [Halobellus limi]SEG60229.1 2-dehydro-3-deoxyphosphogluconate aldolase / (4S)-4-hydroxy-2-oxoglutarate aldolase [Halobellus limi]